MSQSESGLEQGSRGFTPDNRPLSPDRGSAEHREEKLAASALRGGSNLPEGLDPEGVALGVAGMRRIVARELQRKGTEGPEPVGVRSVEVVVRNGNFVLRVKSDG